MEAKKIRLNKIKKVYLKRLEDISVKAFVLISPIKIYFSGSNEPTSKLEKENLDYKLVKKNHYLAKNFYDSGYIHIVSDLPVGVDINDLLINLNFGGEGLVYDKYNNPYETITAKESLLDRCSLEKGKTIIKVTDSIIKDNKIDFYIDTGFNGSFRCLKGVKPILEYANLIKENPEISSFYYDYLSVVTLTLQLHEKEIEATLENSFNLFKENKIEEAKASLSKYINSTPTNFTMYCVGHSHLDLAWLWPIRETKRKSVRTLMAQINNIDKYPEYIYGVSQPWQLKQIKQKEPELYNKIKEKVQEGKIELQGGMFVEADTNIPSGESLVRQIFYGKKFYKEEFGLDNKLCWLPDVFGYNGNLPQILKKSGLDYFYTIKLSWNEVNRFPYRSFNWLGIDDSKVLVSMSPSETYNGDGSASELIFAYNNYPEKDLVDKALYVYGNGDGGGGPSKSYLELLNRNKSMYKTPTIKFSSAIDYFKELEKDSNKLPTYKGELYLEKHQGTYTSQSDNKKYNREIEHLLLDVESLYSLAYLNEYDYDHGFLNDIWEEVLLYQFHDILPGSSINRVYKESISRYKEIKDALLDRKEKILTYLVGRGVSRIAYNPTNFYREEYVDGYKYELKPYSFVEGIRVDNDKLLVAGKNHLANGVLDVTFNESGEIVSLKDNKNNQYCKQYLNRLVLYKDKPMHFEAWDINTKYLKSRPIVLKAYKHDYYKNSDRALYRTYYKYKKNSYVVETILKRGCDYLIFNVEARSHMPNMMLRADFIPTMYNDSVTCDIQYGAITRSTKEDNSINKAMFEICANKYVDVSSENKGLSVLSASKYGFRAKNGLVSIDLLRNPTFPDKSCDIGFRKFTYGLYPHDNNFAIDSVKNSYFINKEVSTLHGKNIVKSLMSFSSDNVVLEVIKKKEKANSLIARIYEPIGKNVSVDFTFNYEYKGIYETDLMENRINKINSNTLEFKPFEIKTIEIEL